MPKMKLILWIFLGVLLLTVLLVAICHFLVVHNASGRLYDDTDSIPHRPYGLLLGTSPKSRYSGQVNMFFKYRIDAAVALYKSGKVDTILVSGSAHSYEGVDETASMRDSLVSRGVPAEVIMTDGEGIRTIESVLRARDNFGIKSYTVISQRFHNERTLYLSDHLGLHDTIAYNAVSPYTGWSFITYIREYLARVKMFLDII